MRRGLLLFSLQYLAYFNGATAGRASRRWINGAARALRPRQVDPDLRFRFPQAIPPAR